MPPDFTTPRVTLLFPHFLRWSAPPHPPSQSFSSSCCFSALRPPYSLSLITTPWIYPSIHPTLSHSLLISRLSLQLCCCSDPVIHVLSPERFPSIARIAPRHLLLEAGLGWAGLGWRRQLKAPLSIFTFFAFEVTAS